MFNNNYLASTPEQIDKFFAQLKQIILENNLSIVTGVNGSWRIKEGRPTKKTPNPTVTYKQDTWLDGSLFQPNSAISTLNKSDKLMLMLVPTDLIAPEEEQA